MDLHGVSLDVDIMGRRSGKLVSTLMYTLIDLGISDNIRKIEKGEISPDKFIEAYGDYKVFNEYISEIVHMKYAIERQVYDLVTQLKSNLRIIPDEKRMFTTPARLVFGMRRARSIVDENRMIDVSPSEPMFDRPMEITPSLRVLFSKARKICLDTLGEIYRQRRMAMKKIERMEEIVMGSYTKVKEFMDKRIVSS